MCKHILYKLGGGGGVAWGTPMINIIIPLQLGSGSGSGSGSGLEPESGSGSGLEPESGSGSGLEPESGSGSGLEPESGSGSGSGSGQALHNIIITSIAIETTPWPVYEN